MRLNNSLSPIDFHQLKAFTRHSHFIAFIKLLHTKENKTNKRSTQPIFKSQDHGQTSDPKRKKERLVTCCNVGQRLKKKQRKVSSSCILCSRPKRSEATPNWVTNCIRLFRFFRLTLRLRTATNTLQKLRKWVVAQYPSLEQQNFNVGRRRD